MKAIDTIKLDGKERQIKIRYVDVQKISLKYASHVNFSKDNKSLLVDNKFFIWATWLILVKKGFWIFKKPFKSANQLRKLILKDEFENIVNIISSRILDIKESSNDTEPVKDGDKKTGN